MKQEDFGRALERKEFDKAWDMANNIWNGSIRKRQAVLYEMLKTLLDKEVKT